MPDGRHHDGRTFYYVAYDVSRKVAWDKAVKVVQDWIRSPGKLCLKVVPPDLDEEVRQAMCRHVWRKRIPGCRDCGLGRKEGWHADMRGR